MQTAGSTNRYESEANINAVINDELAKCTCEGLANALHDIQDSYSPVQGSDRPWTPRTNIMQKIWHAAQENMGAVLIPFNFGTKAKFSAAAEDTLKTIKNWEENCGCK